MTMLSTVQLFPNERTYDALAAAAASRYGLALPFVKAIMAVESGFTASARRGESGGIASIGLMQVTPAAAWGSSAIRHTEAELYDPATNLDRGCAFLSWIRTQVGADEACMASAFNGGVQKAIGFGGRVDHDVTVCLEWKPDARPRGVRTIADDCARPHTAHAGEFGNQTYVDRVMQYRRYYSTATLRLTPDQAGAIVAGVLGVAAVLVLARS